MFLAKPNTPSRSKQPGAYIRSLEGELWGRVVCDQGRSWQLASGRLARKETPWSQPGCGFGSSKPGSFDMRKKYVIVRNST